MQYSCISFIFVRSEKSKRLKTVLEECSDKIENYFNLNNVIIDYEERQMEKLMKKMKKKFYELFVVNHTKDKNDVLSV